jgi:hypothetical protein
LHEKLGGQGPMLAAPHLAARQRNLRRQLAVPAE